MVDLRKRRCEHDNAHEDDHHYRNYILFMYFLHSISFVYGFDSKGNKKRNFQEREETYRERHFSSTREVHI